MNQVSIRLFGGAAEAFGSAEARGATAATLAEVADWLVSDCEDRVRRGADRLAGSSADPVRLREILEQCSFFVDGEHHRSPDTPVPDGSQVDVLPPFAGG